MLLVEVFSLTKLAYAVVAVTIYGVAMTALMCNETRRADRTQEASPPDTVAVPHLKKEIEREAKKQKPSLGVRIGTREIRPVLVEIDATGRRVGREEYGEDGRAGDGEVGVGAAGPGTPEPDVVIDKRNSKLVIAAGSIRRTYDLPRSDSDYTYRSHAGEATLRTPRRFGFAFGIEADVFIGGNSTELRPNATISGPINLKVGDFVVSPAAHLDVDGISYGVDVKWKL